ncbi:MAG: response regulator transcription factor [Bacteroidetes bacterium]|nr:response regulator transcription factor [Bacteroidota bacterium]
MERNNPIRALIVDDEPHCLELLALELKNHCPEVEIIEQCPSGKCGIKAIQQLDPELVFLDIDMPYLNGFEMLDLIPSPKFKVIFTTAHDEFAIQAFRISAVDYLLKPIDGKELRRAVDKYRDQRESTAANRQVEFLLRQIEDFRKDKLQRVAFPTFEGLVFVDLEDILYCRSESNYCHVILQNSDNLLISKTLKEVEEMLQPFSFLRVHNSFLVNLKEISEFHKAEGGFLIMSNGDEVRVSRSRRTDLLNHFG